MMLTGSYLIAHLATRWLAPYADPVIMPAIALINGIGVIFIWRLDLGFMELDDRADASPFSGGGFRQGLWTLTAVVCFAVVLYVVRDHRVLARLSYTAGFVGIGLVMLPAVLPARYSEVNGAKIWVTVAGFSVQPGEFAKLALMVFFAAYLVAKRDVLSLASKRFLGIDFPRGRDLGPVVAAWAASLLVLIFERDLGSSLMYFGIFIVMLYIATERTSWLLIGLGLFASGAIVAWQLFSHVQLRVSIWLDPFKDANGDGFQIVQSLFGLGSGGLFGSGPGAGNPELLNQYAASDFIFTTLGEELGLFGLVALLMLYMLVAQRGIRASLDVRDSFGKLLAGGLAFSLALQVFVIVGGVSKLIPLTGLTTPFLSMGGSSLVANWCLVALLMRISDSARRPIARRPQTLQLRDAPTEMIRR
ncbi:MAG: FtsW/RodA/SpoVE family cell cycle protein [Corynebacteriales bacterium]|nr:FtsW/RodA/SpoVE family cell cycle protein [Mycobacteriales bacterium]